MRVRALKPRSQPASYRCGQIWVANGHLLPSCPDASCSFTSRMANCSARTTASCCSRVRSRRVASLRMSERCCSSSCLVSHSMTPPRPSLWLTRGIRNSTNLARCCALLSPAAQQVGPRESNVSPRTGSSTSRAKVCQRKGSILHLLRHRPLVILAMPHRRLEDRIRELCARAIYERGAVWEETLHQLERAIQEHTL